MFIVKLSSVVYAGKDIGNDISFTSSILGQKKTLSAPLNRGTSFKPSLNNEILYSSNVSPASSSVINILFTVIENDLFVNDSGKTTYNFTVPRTSIKSKTGSSTVSVMEGSSTASFTFNFEITCLYPLFKKLWASHPRNQGVNTPCTPVEKKHNENQCAIRMGVCLTKAGINLKSFSGVTCWHPHSEIHPLRAQELANWIQNNRGVFGLPIKMKAVTAKRFEGKLGIVFFMNFWGTGNQNDHIDIWDGKNMPTGANNDYFQRSQEVWFWQL